MSRQFRMLLLDGINGNAISQLTEAGFLVEPVKTISPNELLRVIPQVHFLGVRSKTIVTKEILEAGVNLLAVGRGGTDMNTIDVETATNLGIVAFNTPGANAESVAECVMAQIISALHRLTKGMMGIERGEWLKQGCEGHCLQGKTVGIVGLGYVGKWVTRFLEVIPNVSLLSSDINPTAVLPWIPQASLTELLTKSDIVSLHVALTESTKKMINQETLARMKRGAILVNFARGALIDEGAIVEALRSGQLSCYVADTYQKEPPDFTSSPLFADPNLFKEGKVIFTPHLAASTDEAQESVAEMLIKQAFDFFQNGRIPWGANFPTFQLERQGKSRLIVFHPDVQGMIASILEVIKKFANVAGSVNQRIKPSGMSYTVVDIDDFIGPEMLEQIQKLELVRRIHWI